MTNSKDSVMVKVELSEKEKRLIELLRTIPYGQVVIFQEKNEPVRIVRIEESVKL